MKTQRELGMWYFLFINKLFGRFIAQYYQWFTNSGVPRALRIFFLFMAGAGELPGALKV